MDRGWAWMVVVGKTQSLWGMHMPRIFLDGKIIASLEARNYMFLAYQTRFSAIFSSANKSYFTYHYPTCGIDKKKRITTRVVNTLIV